MTGHLFRTWVEDLGGSRRRVFVHNEENDATFSKEVDLLDPDEEIRGHVFPVEIAAQVVLLTVAIKHAEDGEA